MKEGLRTIAGICAIAYLLPCAACASGSQLKLKGPLHPEYSSRIPDNRRTLDRAEETGFLKFLQVDIEP